MPYTLQQFGQLVKQKYPQYQNIPDEELAKQIIEKYPVYKQYIAETPATTQTTAPAAQQYQPSTKSSFVEEYETQKILKEGEEAKKFLEMPWYKQLFTGRVLKEVPGATAQVLLKEPARFVRSAIEIPHTLTTGKPEEKVTRLPLIGEIPSYQKEAYERTMAGEPLWKAIGIPAGKTILGGMQTGAMAKGLIGDVYLTGRETIEFKVPTWVAKEGKIVLEPGAKAGEVRPGLLPKAVEKFIQNRRLGIALEETMPLANKKHSTEAMQEGRIKIEGLSRKVKIEPTEEDIERAQTVQHLIKRNDPLGNEMRITNEIERISQQTEEFLNENPAQFRFQDLKASLSKVRPKSMLTKSDTTLSNAYNTIKEGMIDKLEELKPETTADLWRARIELDNLFEREVGGKAWDDIRVSAAKEAYWDLREAINKFIANRTPEETFRENLKTLHHLYEAAENIAERNYKLIGTVANQRFWASHPLLKTIGKAAVGIGAGVLGLREIRKLLGISE